MQAIVTKFLGPTDTKGSRVVARAEAGRVVCAWNSAANEEDNHREVADMLIRKMGWGDPSEWAMGWLPRALGGGGVLVHKGKAGGAIE